MKHLWGTAFFSPFFLEPPICKNQLPPESLISRQGPRMRSAQPLAPLSTLLKEDVFAMSKRWQVDKSNHFDHAEWYKECGQFDNNHQGAAGSLRSNHSLGHMLHKRSEKNVGNEGRTPSGLGFPNQRWYFPTLMFFQIRYLQNSK